MLIEKISDSETEQVLQVHWGISRPSKVLKRVIVSLIDRHGEPLFVPKPSHQNISLRTTMHQIASQRTTFMMGVPEADGVQRFIEGTVIF